MKFFKDNIVSILIIIVAVLVTLQLSSMWRKSPSPIDNREEIKMVQQERDYYRGKYDSVISQARQRDTVLIQQYIQTNDKIKNIRPTVIDYSKEQLRAEIKRYALPPGE